MNPNSMFVDSFKMMVDSNAGILTRSFMITFSFMIPVCWVGWWIAEGVMWLDEKMGW
jgi:hypothetical protein